MCTNELMIEQVYWNWEQRSQEQWNWYYRASDTKYSKIEIFEDEKVQPESM